MCNSANSHSKYDMYIYIGVIVVPRQPALWIHPYGNEKTTVLNSILVDLVKIYYVLTFSCLRSLS